MANSLTGDFDAVAQVKVRIVDGILANLHRKGPDEDDDSPGLLHSFAMTVGTLSLSTETLHVLAWAGSYQPSNGLVPIETSLQYSPAGVGLAYTAATKELERAELDSGPLVSLVRGTAKAQVSTPTVTLRPNATSEVTATFRVRVLFFPQPGSKPLGAPIHGEVRATFDVDLQEGPGGKTLLDVTPSTDDGEIQFVPAPGTVSAAEAEAIAVQIRLALRNRFEPTTLELDESFPFAGFKALGTGDTQAIALPVVFSGSAPAAGLSGVGEEFLKFNDHFGAAISRELLDTRLQPMLDGVKDTSFQLTISSLGITWATYNVSVSSATLAWLNGELELTVQGSAVTGAYFFPNYNFTVKQKLTLDFNAEFQSVKLVAVGDPVITGLPGFAMGTAKAEIKASRDQAIADAQPQIQQALMGEVSIQAAMQAIGGAPQTELTAVEIEPRGVILRGQVKQRVPSEAIVSFEENPDGSGFTALESWIPGGWIERFIWTWREGGFSTPWGASVELYSDTHSFLLPEPASQPPMSGVCLQVEGTQLRSTGTPVPTIGGEACSVSVPSWMVATMPPEWDLFLPIWEHELGPEEVVAEGIHAHVNGLAHSSSRTTLGANSVVHFPGESWARSREVMGRAVEPASRLKVPLAIFLVLPPGALAERRSVLERKLGELNLDPGAWVAITEDYEGRWAKAFAAEKTPSTYLLNARGELAWKHFGVPDAADFREAERHLISGRPLRYRQVRLAVEPGGRAPDFLFPYAEGRPMPLRRFRGRRVIVSFWKSWSAPCLKELRHLQRLQNEAGRDGPLILAVNGGEDPKRIAEFCREHELTLTVVPDPHRGIVRRYGVNCWPTTVTIGEDGRVERAQLGATRRKR